MQQVSQKKLRILYAGILLAGFMLLFLPCAKGDLLLFATADDCAAAPVSAWAPDAPHAVVLQKANAGKQKEARQAMEKAGIKETVFLNCPSVKASGRTAGTLKKRWATKSNTARVASLLRRWEDRRIIYYASGEEDLRFLSDFADLCARSANDPSCRNSKHQEDEYLHEVTLLVDGAAGAERAPSPADTSWRDLWEDQAQYDLSGLPETDSDGFLPEGEFVLEESKKGLWVYLSPTLRIVITRHKVRSFRWYEAEILRKPDGDTLHVVTSLNGLGNNPAKVAAENRLVLGINTDYYQFRANLNNKVGLIIRDGKVIHESSGATSGLSLPPLDTLLLDAEGGFRVDKAGDLDSEKALALGAKDVLAFGPILVKDSRLRVLTVTYHNSKEPRTAIGLLGQNHYLIVVVEGRLKNIPGMTLDRLGQLMAARGCTEAINLDGGHTSALIFMGKRLNQIGNLAGTGTTSPRNMSELLGIGTYSR